jgi:O-antigen/teichoic acid export membrane protein
LGVIKKQSIQGTLLLYIGVFIGFLTTAVLFPRILEDEEIGLVNTLLAYSIVFAQFATLGFNSVITRMFSYFRDYKNKHNNFFFFVFAVIVIGSLLAISVFYLIKPFIISQNIENSKLFVEYIDFLIPLVVFTLIFYLLDNYYTLLFKAVRGILLKELIQKVLILTVLIFYYFRFFGLSDFVTLYVVAISLPAVALVITLIIDGEFVIRPNLSFVGRDLAKTMFSVSVFGILSGLVGSANIQIDKAMTSSMLSLGATGIYSTVAVFALFIKTPSKAMLKIASAIVAEAWRRNDVDELKKVYRETSFNQYMIALLVFIGLWANIDNIFEVITQKYISGKYVILILGVAYTFEMATGAANNIIGTSKQYKYLTWFVTIMLVLAVVSNLVFIPLFKVTGIALATGLTSLGFSLLKIFFIGRRFKMYPFNIKFVYVTLIGIVVYFSSLLIPTFDNYIVDIGVRSAFILVFYFGLLVLVRVSNDLNKVIEKNWIRYFGK